MKNTETERIVVEGYSSPDMNVISARFEQGFCQSFKGSSTSDLTEEEGKFEWI